MTPHNGNPTKFIFEPLLVWCFHRKVDTELMSCCIPCCDKFCIRSWSYVPVTVLAHMFWSGSRCPLIRYTVYPTEKWVHHGARDEGTLIPDCTYTVSGGKHQEEDTQWGAAFKSPVPLMVPPSQYQQWTGLPSSATLPYLLRSTHNLNAKSESKFSGQDYLLLH